MPSIARIAQMSRDIKVLDLKFNEITIFIHDSCTYSQPDVGRVLEEGLATTMKGWE